MITKEQALTSQVFHMENACTPLRQARWRRNGKTTTWKTRPNDFVIPVKHGLYEYGRITGSMAGSWHAEEDCPNRRI